MKFQHRSNCLGIDEGWWRVFSWSAAPCILSETEPYDVMCEPVTNYENNLEDIEGLFEYDMSDSYGASSDIFTQFEDLGKV